MAIINKTGIGNGNTIQAEHITRIIDTLTNSTGSHVTVSGSFTGTATLTSATISGGTATLSSAVINGTLTNGTTLLATGASSHAEGQLTTASGNYSHAEGENSIASGRGSHAEGSATIAVGSYSHAQGNSTYASGQGARAAGLSTSASGNWSHAEGLYTNAVQTAAHTEGYYTFAREYAHAEGYLTSASQYYSHAEGQGTQTTGTASHAEGRNTIAIGSYSHAEGNGSVSFGSYSHAEGYGTDAEGDYSHAEGSETRTTGQYSHAEGYRTTGSGNYSHAEGNSTEASGLYSHAEGEDTVATNQAAHSEGANTTASGVAAHAEGYFTIAQAGYSHAEGSRTWAFGNTSHAEGYNTTSSGWYSHAEGGSTHASGAYSHAEGEGTITSGSFQHASGKWNKHGDSTSLTIIGDGTSDAARSDIFKTKVGAVEISGSLSILSRGATSATDAVTITNSSGINLLTVQNDGNVGIGETTPTSRLYISASAPGISASSVVIQTLTVRHPAPNSDYLEISNTRVSGGLDWNGAGYRLQNKIDATWMGYMQFNGRNDNGISFGTGTSTTSGSLVPERMRITGPGYVGIGTTVPSSSLHVKGNGGALTLEGIDHTYMAFHPDGYYTSSMSGANNNRKGYIGYANVTEDWLTIANEDANKGVALKAGGYVRQYVDPIGRISFGTSDTVTPSHSIELQQYFGISPNTADYTDICQNIYWDDTIGWRSRQGGPGSLIRMRGGSNSTTPLQASGSIEFVVFGSPSTVPYGTFMNPTQSMWIDANAYVGIGSSWNNYSTKPSVPLHVVGSQTVTSQQGGNVTNVVAKIASYYDGDVRGAALLLGSMNGNAPFIASENTASLYLKTSNVARISISGSGFVGIGTDAPTKTLHVNGEARIGSIPAVGGGSPLYYSPILGELISNASDARLKTNITTLTGSLDKVNSLRGVTFNWLKQPSGSRYIGFIAQEVESVVPELVYTNSMDPEQYKGVYYAEMTALLVEAVKTLSAENESLKSELQTIKTHLGL